MDRFRTLSRPIRVEGRGIVGPRGRKGFESVDGSEGSMGSNGRRLEVEGSKGSRVDGRVVDGSTGGNRGSKSRGPSVQGSKGPRVEGVEGVEGSSDRRGRGVHWGRRGQGRSPPYPASKGRTSLHNQNISIGCTSHTSPLHPTPPFFCVLATQWSTANPRIIKRARLCTQIHMQGRHAPN